MKSKLNETFDRHIGFLKKKLTESAVSVLPVKGIDSIGESEVDEAKDDAWVISQKGNILRQNSDKFEKLKNSGDEVRAWKLLYEWVRTGAVDYKTFRIFVLVIPTMKWIGGKFHSHTV